MTILYVSLRKKIGSASSSDSTPAMSEINLLDEGLSSSNIDARLIYLASIGTTDVTIDIKGNDDRTSASDAAVATLLENGCYIDEDYTP